ncbi:hypothetical protein [Streptomyces sp. NPDC005760]|uniref:hypothetical protein n=1 Tax=Streptomyces sp. NPDC005760 TaxID=3156718 RepID=UPI0033E5D9F4
MATATLRTRIADESVDEMREIVTASSRTRSPDPERAVKDALAAYIRQNTALGDGRHVLADRLDHYLDVRRMRESSFWEHQELLRKAVLGQAPEAARNMARYLPPSPPDETGETTVGIRLLPGVRLCYGLDGGGQVFGLYDGATPAETVLFLEHTYYHDLSTRWNTPRLDRAERTAQTAEGLLVWTLGLIRNEGIANIAVLDGLERLRREQTGFSYFTYAGLIGEEAATARAMTAFRTLVADLSPATAARIAVNISRVLKNPRLPVINLIGIHMARAVIAHHGLPTLLNVDGQEPEDFFALYAATGDSLVPELLGPHRELEERVCRVRG